MNPTRRAPAHTRDLTEFDVERMEMRVREWLRVVGLDTLERRTGWVDLQEFPEG
jgi:hypothetical protein